MGEGARSEVEIQLGERVVILPRRVGGEEAPGQSSLVGEQGAGNDVALVDGEERGPEAVAEGHDVVEAVLEAVADVPERPLWKAVTFERRVAEVARQRDPAVDVLPDRARREQAGVLSVRYT